MLERTRIFLTQFQTQFLGFYQGLTKARKIILITSIVGAFFALISLSLWRPTVRYETAFTGLTQEDKNEILAFLKSKNVSDFKLEGDTISFPEEKMLDLRMQLAQEGIPNAGVGIGWEKFDTQNFGVTDFDQRVNKLRAVQGELARTINKLENVEGSRVHIVLPNDAIFTEDKKPATASIYLRLRRGKTLSQRQVQGILHLVAHAVEGLETQNIAIVDQSGNMLTKPGENPDGFESTSNSQRDYQQKLERELEAKIREILSRVVGHDRVIAKVQADLDFKRVETTIQDVDPERTVVIASQRNEQSTSGTGLNPTGVPGTKSNLPGEREDTENSGSATKSQQNSEHLNFEFKKTLSKIVEPVGTVRKLSTAVLVDGRLEAGKFVARSPEEIGMITKLVKNAIGFHEGRDSLTVETAQFEPDEFKSAEQAADEAHKVKLIQTGIFSSVAVAAMIFLYFAVIRPYFRWLTFDPNKKTEESMTVVDYELERSGEAAKRVQVQEEVPFEKLSPREQILYLAKHDPKKTTEAIRQLLSPQHN